MITVGSGADLTINDTTGKDGKITGGSVGQDFGGGVTVDSGKLTLKGGAISGNANTYNNIGNCGGGIHVKNGGKFFMEGGEISGNTSYVGGGVCSDASATAVSVTGGVIKNNTTERFGSAIWAGRTDNSTFLIDGSAEIVDYISKWTSDKNGEASVNFTRLLISGDPTVHGDWKTSGTSSPNTHINLDNNGSGIQCVELDGALTNDTGTPKLTISPIYRWGDLSNGQTFVFTKNWNKYMGTAHPADYFKVDDSVSGVRIIRKNGEAAVTGSSDLGDLYITFDANEGKGTMEPQLAEQTNITLNKNTFTREGYAFAGWNTQKDGSGTGYTDKAAVTLTGDLTLYAQWTEPVVSIISGETVTVYSSISDAVNAWTTGSTLKLLADVKTDSTIIVPSGEHTLDLNGHGIKMTGSGSVINVGSGAKLDLTDSDQTKTHKFDVPDGAGLATLNETSGNYTVNGGYITGGNAENGGGIFIEEHGEVTMNGGTLIGNRADDMGAGVRLENYAAFTLNDGAIAYNKANVHGGGINAQYRNHTTITVTGGSIHHNICQYSGGAITMDDDPNSYLYLYGGVIKDNNSISESGNAPWHPAGIAGNRNIHIKGSVQLYDNINLSSSNKGSAKHNLTINAADGDNPASITLDGTLNENTKIAVSLYQDGGVFTSGWKDKMGDADPSKYFTSDYDDYIIALDDSGEACLRYPDVPDVSAEGFEGDYDGEGHSITVSAPDGAEIKYGTGEGSYTLTENPTYTDAGTYTVFYEVSKEKYTSVYGSAQVKIKKINAAVKITGHHTTVDYDSKAHSADGYDAETDSELYDVTKDFKYNGKAEALRSIIGTTMMGLSAEKFENLNANFTSVTFEVVDGYVTINPVAVTVTITGHNATADYDGKAHSVSGYDVEISNPLYSESDFAFSGTAKAERTNAGTTEMGLAAEQFENTNGNFANVTFDITDGYMTVEPINVKVIVTSNRSTIDYDGKSHTVSGYTFAVTSALYTESDFTFSGTAEAKRTDAGTTNMGLTAEQFENTSNNFAEVTFEVTDGSLTINPIDVTVTVTGYSSTVDYDGVAHIAEGYDVEISDPLYSESDFTFNGTAKAERTDAGTTMMGLNANQFKNTNSNLAEVTFKVADGCMTIDPIDVTVAVTGHHYTVDYDGKAHSISGYDAAASSDLYGERGIHEL